MMFNRDARGEWRNFWYVPITAALGYATGLMYVYSMGPFIEPIQSEFGWSRTQVTSGIAIAAFLSAIFCIPIGMLVDRLGPRRLGLAGVLLMCAAVALLGTATGSGTNWIVLWCFLAFSTLGVQTTVWITAVNSRFTYSRGLALGVTLSGASVSAAIFPVIATLLIGVFGWRTSFMVMGGGWLLLVFPLMFLGFRGAHDQAGARRGRTASESAGLTGLTRAEGLRSSALYRLVLVGFFYAFTAVGMVVHFVPILTDAGTEPLAAAGTASLVGIFSLVGRLSTGALLDRFPAHRVGAVVSTFPIVASALLIFHGDSAGYQVAAAILFGFTLGSEVDVVAYLAARFFGMKNFGTLFGVALMALAMGTAFGPLGAGVMYDHFGSYTQFLALVAALMGTGALLLLSLGSAPSAEEVMARRAVPRD